MVSPAAISAIFLQIGKLELFEQRALLRRLAEPFVLQLLDRVLELLDQQCAVLGFTFRRRRPRFGDTQRLALCKDERMCSG
jgi:hypothetical protein